MTALDTLLDRLPRATLVVGKGGVGKTTCAAGIAAMFAGRDEDTLLLSTDPAAALATVTGEAVTTGAQPLEGWPHLTARQLDAGELRRAFLDQWRDTIADIVDRGTYLERADINGVVDAALPGIDEIFALLALAELLADRAAGRAYERIIIDTAPTGHTLRLLAMPDTFSALLSMLDLMQGKHRFMVRALTHRYTSDRADAFLSEMRLRIDGLRRALADGTSVAAVVVTRDEPVVRAETARYIDHLRELHVRVAGVILNAVSARRRSSSALEYDRRFSQILIPRQATPPAGLAAIVDMLGASPRATGTNPGRRRPRLSRRGKNAVPVDPAELVRTLTIVGGKGGVGKTTVACALAIAAVDADGRRTLLVSTDPAASLADALGEGAAPWTHGDAEYELPDPRGLVVRQMDATAAFGRMRDEYQTRIDGLFAALLGHGLDVGQDRAIVRDLLAFAPPGIDELYALSILGDALHEGRVDRIIVDPAPTGHLLRLLDMPGLALDWSHRLLRLMLQFRDVVSLGDSAADLLDFAKRTRALDALLHDPSRCGLVLVSLDEPVVRAETERLATEVRNRGIDVSAVAWNRVTESPFPLPQAAAVRQVCAEEMKPSPIGVAALRGWSHAWSALSSNL